MEEWLPNSYVLDQKQEAYIFLMNPYIMNIYLELAHKIEVIDHVFKYIYVLSYIIYFYTPNNLFKSYHLTLLQA